MIKKSELKDKFLVIELAKVMKEEEFTTLFINRSTEEEIIVSPLWQSTNELFIDLSDINFITSEYNRYDMYFLFKNKKYRARMQSIYQKKKIDRFFSNIYRYNSANVLVPYITTNNNLSLLCGNAAEIFRTYCQYVPGFRSVSAVVNINKDALQLHIPSCDLHAEDIYVTYYNKADETYSALDYEVSSDNPEDISITRTFPRYFDLQDKLFLLSKTRNVIEYTSIHSTNTKITKTNVVNHSKSIEQKPIIRSNITVEEIESIGNKLCMKVNSNDLVYLNHNSIRVFLKDKNEGTYFINHTDIKIDEVNTLKLDLTSFFERHTLKRGRWSFHFLIETENYQEELRIGAFQIPSLEKHERYYEPIAFHTYHLITPYLTANNALSLVIKPKVALHEEILHSHTEITRFERKGRSKFTGEVFLQLEDSIQYTVESLLLKYRNKMEEREYLSSLKEEKQTDNTSIISFEIKPEDFTFEQFYWDIFLQVRIGRQLFLIKAQNPTEEIKENIFLKEQKYTIKCKDGFVLHPYITNNNSLALFYKEKTLFENFWVRMKSKLAYQLSERWKLNLERKEIWLVYEKFSSTAQDNSYYFFKYMYDNHPGKNVYYIIDKQSPEYKNVKHMKDKIIPYMSLKHLLYLYASKLFIASEAKTHSYIFRQKNGRAIEEVRNKPFVYLKHGVIGLKNVGYIFKKAGQNGADLYVTSADWETEIVHDYFGYGFEDIIQAGLCRWDALIDKSKEIFPKEITLMPTWRNWLEDVSDETFMKSSYYLQYMELLQSEELRELLKEHNIRLNFNIHPKFMPYIDKFQIDTEHIKIFQLGEVKINELLMRSSLLITDYSSVAWDFYYLKKPVVFFQFDYETYEELQGSYIDMETDLFGERTMAVPELLEVISEYIENDFCLKDKYKEIWKHSFKYTDKNNSKRTYEAIKRNANKLGLTKNTD